MLESPDVKHFVFYKRKQYYIWVFQIAISALFILAFLKLSHKQIGNQIRKNNRKFKKIRPFVNVLVKGDCQGWLISIQYLKKKKMKYSLSQNYNKYGLITAPIFFYRYSVPTDGGSVHTWHIRMKWKQI